MVLAGTSILAVVVGAALIGGHKPDEAVARVAQASAVAPVASGPSRADALIENPAASPSPSIIVLDTPPTPLPVVTTRDLIVRGHLSSGTGPVLVALETSRGESITGKTVGPMTLPRPGFDPSPPFEVRLTLPNPRPVGTAILEIIAYDIHGITQDTRRWRLWIGAIGPEASPVP